MTHFPLTALHLNFTCEATTPIALAPNKAGAQMRGALSNVMSRAYCAQGGRGDAAHVQTCPVCWLLAANEKPGEERRGYALDASALTQQTIRAGERFEFGLTLFGDARRYLPYFLLAVHEAGREGVGRFSDGQRGQFRLCRADALNPLDGTNECILAEGETLVHTPTRTITHADIMRPTDTPMSEHVSFALHFLSPLRLIANDQLVKTPDFGAIFKQALLRTDQLARQFCDANYRRDLTGLAELQARADRVRLLESRTHWVEIFSGSQRTGTQTPISGFMGSARYSCDAVSWRALLPWLLWAQITQVGKDTVKGNGVMRVERLDQ
jgi:hypothetical protein